MVDDVIVNKAATIEHCCNRAREEYRNAGRHFPQDFTRQDAAILNIQRACEAAIDLAAYLVKRDRLGVPQSSGDLFNLLADSAYIEGRLGEVLRKMVGFRNTAVHNYQKMQLPIVVAIIERHLDDLVEFARIALQQPD
ncbi:type VII toxin-antitoxin system HepT family RNase toxin [Alloalcanivorax gelatiniphagus]|uniref:DUF86 domain-containing protein n=1 Tax=Alloalcanivorax gelatiniphagus TaxID=1194167 RepID=A0ABY2XHL8_9GAMM|nr:DUF86 domain-containing protein [Alloalcanivorax gelatiniphagus]TMW10492.1 DUF86 domain-containing protein [Alloalcanivorax gelatiniphagus]|tara:strand:- start:18 stop:431 length:414 start_codon:yes stop_codon:yes gene_type:complete